MPAFRALPLALLAVAASASAQQAPLVLKAGTPITISNKKEFAPREAHLGEEVEFITTYPVRSGKIAVIPKGTLLHGHVTTLKPNVEITLDPVTVAGTSVAFAGEPFAVKGAKRDDTPGTPPEFAWHYEFTTKEKFEIAGAVIVLTPIAVAAAVIVLPIYGIYVITHPRHGRKDAYTKSLVTLAADTTFDPQTLPTTKSYAGLPIIYVVDHYRTDHGQLLCNAQPFFAKAFRQQIAVRVPAQIYTFSATESGQTSATVDAKEDGRYIVFRDKVGLHAEDLATRPDLLTQGLLPGEDKSDHFFFDYTKIPAEQQASLDEQRKKRWLRADADPACAAAAAGSGDGKLGYPPPPGLILRSSIDWG